jgi:hypothetical protein
VISEEVARQAELNLSGLPRHEITVRNRREALAIFVIDDLTATGIEKSAAVGQTTETGSHR